MKKKICQICARKLAPEEKTICGLCEVGKFKDRHLTAQDIKDAKRIPDNPKRFFAKLKWW